MKTTNQNREQSLQLEKKKMLKLNDWELRRRAGGWATITSELVWTMNNEHGWQKLEQSYNEENAI